MQHDTRVSFYAVLSGFGLGGLADGILLHRILQWHHVMTSRRPDLGLPTHLQWDGIFDVLMMAGLVAGLWGLCRHRGLVPATARTGRALAGGFLLGFGLWNIIDALLVHWVLGLHRIRPGAESPLAWDLGWLLAFGLLPLFVGLSLRATPGDDPPKGTTPTTPRSDPAPRD